MVRYKLLFLIIGPLTIWALFFLTLYGVQAVGCEMGLQTAMWGGLSALRALVIAVFLLGTAIAIYLANFLWQQTSADVGLIRVMRYCALASLFSTAVVFSGVLWLQLC